MNSHSLETGRRYVVTGASGRLGATVVSLLAAEGGTVLAVSGRRTGHVADVELTPISFEDTGSLATTVRSYRPTHLLHLGGITTMAQALADPDRATAVNATATAILAEECRALGARFLLASTDMVFDGTAAPYCEADVATPTSMYARTKVAAESSVLDGDGVVVRLPLLYGPVPGPRQNQFAEWTRALRRGQVQRLFADEYRTPVSYHDAARSVVAIARAPLSGILHVGGPQRLSRFELVAALARRLGVADPCLVAVSRESVAGAEPRPEDLSLDSSCYLQHFAALAPGPPSLLEVGSC